ncbi:unnamed protein product [Rhizophagus irregularis]|uniref:Uncharacterized protein n=1 Tax=Rhizophagus irregularis TaxID=588596 RepID=A0A915Z5B5_9GLOM|nr:unnamed protein product [Rhizophagus irregularis]
MAFSSITNLSKAFHEGDDLDTAVNRALYYELVNHTFRKYSSFSLTEEDIARTVEKASGDGEYLTNLLMEHHEALSTFSIGDIQSLYHLLFLFYESFNFIQASVSKGWKALAKVYATTDDITKTNTRRVQICRGSTDGNRNFRSAKNAQTPIKSCSTTRGTNQKPLNYRHSIYAQR